MNAFENSFYGVIRNKSNDSEVIFLLGYVKLKDTNEELYESDLLQQLHKDSSAFQKIQYWLCYAYFQFVVLIKYHMGMITTKQIGNALLFVLPFSIKEISHVSKKKIKRCIKSLKKLMEKYNVESIVIADNLKKFLNDLELPYWKENVYKKVHQIQGEKLIPYMIKEILEYIMKQQNRQLALEDIYICIKENKPLFIENIWHLIHEFRTINIVTPSIKNFSNLVDQMEEKENVMITLTNNKKKSLKRAHYIINFDFTEEELQKYQIYRRAIIIGIRENGFYENATFDGIQVRQIGIDTGKTIKDFLEQYHLLQNYSLSTLYEGIFLTKSDFKEVRKQIKMDEIVITDLYGKNGKIHHQEYLNVVD